MKPTLFVDFDGTLCHERYWRSLPADKYQLVQDFLFGVAADPTLRRGWLRGKYTAEHINRLVAAEIGVPFEALWDLFVKDCRTMRVSPTTLKKLGDLRARFSVVLVTGNFDSFSRFTQPTIGLDKYFDYVSNSYYAGIAKTDNDGALFLKLADRFGVPISSCIVIDDSPKVCAVFFRLGGTAHLVTPERDIEYFLSKIAAATIE